GIFWTPMVDGMPEDVQQSLSASIPFPARLGRPGEFAGLVAYIAGNRDLNAETIRLDGAGRLAPKDGTRMKAYDVEKGNVVEYNGTVYQVRDMERSSPQGRGGNVRYRFTMYSVPGGNKIDASFDADDELKEVELLRRQASFSYKDGDAFVF